MEGGWGTYPVDFSFFPCSKALCRYAISSSVIAIAKHEGVEWRGDGVPRAYFLLIFRSEPTLPVAKIPKWAMPSNFFCHAIKKELTFLESLVL